MAPPADPPLALDFTLHESGRPDERPPLLRLDEPWNAAAVEQAFERRRAAWYAPGLQPFAECIAQMLAEERQLSERWRGLPGTDHPACWDERSDAAHARPPGRGRRVASWQPPPAWLMPVVQGAPRDLRVNLPLADSAPALASLAAMARAALPPGWQRRHVEVMLELETRVYWGARRVGGEWRACRRRGDGVSRRVPLLTLRAGRVMAPGAGESGQPPRWQRRLAAGVGLLVATPVLVFERQRCWCDRLHAGWLSLRRHLGWTEDRDPTFAPRLQHDEARWNAATGAAALPPRAWRQGLKQGALLRPASVPAAAWQRHAPAERPSAHVVLVHGGLSCARSAFDALLAPLPQWPARAGPVWAGMPLLDRVCTWRFEHDSFVPVAHNIAHLQRWLRREVVRGQPTGTLVLLAHSRGGNVVRFALERLRGAFPGWRFAGLTCGSPHLGTQVFSRIGRRWTGLATLVGAVREMTQGWLGREQLAQLVILERGLGNELPPGFHDVEPPGVARMARGRPQELPPGLWMWGSEWGPGDAQALDRGPWEWLLEDLGGAEVDGDGLVARHSALGGRSAAVQGAHDASPVFHTQYFAHPATRGQIAERLAQLLGG
jgi:hypothetical protein